MGRGELGSKFWDRSLKLKFVKVYTRFILYEAEIGVAFVHVPSLQEFGDMLARRTRKRIQSRDGKCICAC